MIRTTNKPGPGEYRITMLSRPLMRTPCVNNERPCGLDDCTELLEAVERIRQTRAKIAAMEQERETNKE